MGIFSIALQAALGFAKAVISAKKGNLKTSVSLTKKTKDGKTTLKSMDELVYEVVQSAYGNYIRGKTTTMARFVGHPSVMLSPIEQLKLTMELYEPKIKCLIQENTTKKEEDIDVLDRIKEVGISYYSSYLKGLAGEQVIDKKYTLENLFTGKLTSEDMPDAITLLNMVAATKGAYYRGMYNGIKGIWDGGKMLVTETDKVLEGIYQSGSEFLEAPLKNTWEFLGDIKDGFIDSVWRSTPQEIAKDAGELAFDVAISVPTGGAGKVVSGAAKGIGKIKYLDNLVDIGKISQKIPSLQGMPLPAGGVLPFNLADDFLKAPYQMIKPDGEDVAKLTAKGGEIAKEALPDGKDVAQQAKNSFIKDAAKAMPVVEGVKGAEKVADNTPDRKNTPNTSKTDKMEGGENQKPANESGNDKKTTNEKDKTEGENTSKEKNPSDETEGRKVTREDNGGKTGSGVETSGEVKETKVEDLKEKIDDKDGTNAKQAPSPTRVEYGERFTKVNGKKALKPNIEYIDANNYKYVTDDKGRIVSVQGVLIKQKGKRNLYAQRTVGGADRKDYDDGGHLIGTQFNGSGNIDNLVPQNQSINRSNGQWYNMEKKWAKALDKDKRVEVDIKVIYNSSSVRPDSFEVTYFINGKRHLEIIPNP